MDRLTAINNALSTSFAELSEIFADSGTLTFADVREHMERFEEITTAKAAIDAAFAYICERDDAGRSVGSRYPSSYLTKKLGLSRAEAHGRLSRGRKLFAEPEPDSGSEPGPEERADKERARRAARGTSRRVSAEKQRIIDRELEVLFPGAQPDRDELLAESLSAALTRNPEDLRQWVRRRVEQANARAPKRPGARNPFGPYRNRSARIGAQRTDGTCEISITAPAGEAALIKAVLDAGLRPGSNLDTTDSAEDSRTPGQRRFDQLAAVFRHYDDTARSGSSGTASATGTGQRRGCASVVISLTLDDLASADHTTRFATNTGITLDCNDILRIGLSGSDFVVQFDRITGLPLSIGSTRLANLAQRLALLAAQGVCAWEGCTTPFSELEIHHLIPYSRGGPTNIDNLIGLCRQHHRCNNDRQDFTGGLHHTARDPASHRVGVAHPDGTIHFNTTDPATHAPGQRLRHRRVPTPNAPPDPPLFTAPG